MAVDQDGNAEFAHARFHQLVQCGVIRLVQLADAVQCDAETKRLSIDFFGLGNDPRDRAQSAHHANRLGICIARQGLRNQRGVELIRFSIDVKVGARKMCVHQRCAMRDHRCEQLFHESVLRSPQIVKIES